MVSRRLLRNLLNQRELRNLLNQRELRTSSTSDHPPLVEEGALAPSLVTR
ncbi:hypothetical protein ISU10_18335 [Nocardioides agariphilus]|uniref:Uncharacterized protein n=1 Tax=Nocardioides agariphilus TaxID=433664 RepID=A0A930VS96_9ACTN|nr:hypothetical protein [Nocardioides agariphilus]MBF4769732.1 hypothetical protein [Nocardioides agariphilus]